ncbi:hypothetical protein Stsp01_65460 [Streptomyces sp. NBRC 13847]|uniref:replication-relaxation family protein n=1 Tax=Streptomyces TaxID=1883 RepID=UPI0024A432CF|nr:hypothetical protein Stsp01_65460 [Streptomyces sp. NBRC 13847]
MVLAALGVVKVATAEQIRQLMCPGTASAQTVRNGCLELGRDGLVESLGSAGRTNANGNLVSEKLWNLTGPGLEAAAAVLDRPVREMGGTARGAARSGAKHAVKVTDTLAAFLQSPPEPTRPVPRRQPRPVPSVRCGAPAANDTAAAPAAVQERPQGLGQVGSWATEVVLPVSGTLTTPGKNTPRRRGAHRSGSRGAGDVRGGRQRHREPPRPGSEGRPPPRVLPPHGQAAQPLTELPRADGEAGADVGGLVRPAGTGGASAAGDRVHQASRPDRDEQPNASCTP